MKKSVKIIGAGIAGLASAVRMAHLGFEVEVFEKEDRPGGKLGELRWEGYRWDTGPSLYTLPEEVDELFLLSGEQDSFSVPAGRLDLVTRYFWDDGTHLNSFGDPQNFATEVETVGLAGSRRVSRYLEIKKEMYELTRKVFIQSPFNRLSTFFSKDFLRALLRIGRLDVIKTIHQSNSKFFTSPHLVQLFDRYATYTGSDPYRAPATLSMIAHLEHSLGAWFPERGMYSIADELYKLALSKGVNFHFSAPVERLLMEGKEVKGIQAGGRAYPADFVISDIDIHYLYQDLMPGIRMPRKYLKQARSSSALIFYWAMDRTYPGTELHNIFFSKDYAGEFASIFKKKEMHPDPTVYLYISSKKLAGDAPAGGENWFVMVNTPENNGQDWDVYTAAARERVIHKLEHSLGPGIARHIVHEEVRTPVSIQNITGSWKGALYGANSNSRMAAFNRHPNSTRRVRNLYFAGGSVHPGGGIPLCLASAKIVESLVREQQL